MQQALQGIRANAARNGVRYRKKGKYEYGKINFSPAQGISHEVNFGFGCATPVYVAPGYLMCKETLHFLVFKRGDKILVRL